MRVGIFTGSFPVVSETFILRHVTGLIDLGHAVEVFAERRPEAGAPVHRAVMTYGLMERTTYVNPQLPTSSGYWEAPAWPPHGRTWIPGSDRPESNPRRIAAALPSMFRLVRSHPSVALDVLSPAEYGYQARSLSALYRAALLASCAGPCDVAHAHFGTTARAFRFVRKLWSAPFVVSFHGFDATTYPREQGRGVYSRLFQTADAVIANSRFTRARLLQLGCPEPKVQVFPETIDFREIEYHERALVPHEPLRLLSVARLVPIKGLESAIAAVARVRQQLPQVEYTIVGEGPQRPALEALIRSEGLEGRVRLRGAADAAHVQELRSRAHLFLMPSVTIEGDQEAQGLALQEAQAAGLPVIATRHGGLPEGMSPEAGLLVGEGDPDALSRAILALAARSGEWPMMGRAGREFVRAKYDVRDISTRLVRLYENLRAAVDEAA
jgi:colanic acid/amylovoran biosynthesis glycosyltransferase